VNGALEQKQPLYVCQLDGSTLPGNSALLKHGARLLPWPAENVENALSPLLHTSREVQQKQARIPVPPGQLSLFAVF
jgi:hypothetical protein